MKQNEVFNKIGGLIKELNDQYEYLETVKENLNDLELELFASNAQFLTDHIEILCKLNLQSPRSKTSVFDRSDAVEKEKFFEPVVQQMKNGNRLKESKNKAEPVSPAPAETAKAELPDEQPVPHIDLSSGSREDSYSYIRETPEVTKRDLLLEEAQEPGEVATPAAEEITTTANQTKAEPEVTSLPDKPIIAEEELKVIKEPIVFTFDAPMAHSEKKAEPVNFTTGTPAGAEPEIKSSEVVAGPVAKEEIKLFDPVIQPPVVPDPESIKPIEPAFKLPSAKPAVKKEPEEKVLTINQLFSQMADKPVSKVEQLTIKPISDIKLAVTLNDKLLYVKELFNGYNLAYSEAVEILNRFNTFEEAMRFLNTNYVTKNNWDAKPATTAKFYALLKRRYA